VLDRYFGNRPAAAAAFTELQSIESAPLSAAQLFAFVLPKPQILAGPSDYAIEVVAADPQFAGVTA
jgi:hypothetical protein